MPDHPPTPAPRRPIEERLRTALHAAADAQDADAGPPAADRGDLTRRTGARARRRRVGWSAAAAVLLVAGGTGGWLAGQRAGSGDPAEEVAGGPPPTSTPDRGPVGVSVVADAVLPVVADGGSAEEGGPAWGPTPGAPATDGDLAPGANAAYRSIVGLGYWGGGWGGWWGGEPSATIFTRVLPDGTALDVRANRYDRSWPSQVPFWAPAGWCFPSGSVYVGARLPGAVAQAGGLRYDEVRPGTLAVSGSIAGRPEGQPQWLVVVQVPASATTVRATFPDGRTDEMVPVGGVAVLTGRVADGFDLGDDHDWYGPDVVRPDLRIEAVDGRGMVASYAGSWYGTGGVATDGTEDGWIDPYADPGCRAPTELPAPGAEQPADPAGARAAVEASWAAVFDVGGTTPIEERLALIDDPDGVDVAFQRLVDGGISQDILERTTITVTGLVFADATTAYVEYEIAVEEMGPGFEFFGAAHLLDGRWKVARDAACQTLSLGGGTCPPKES